MKKDKSKLNSDNSNSKDKKKSKFNLRNLFLGGEAKYKLDLDNLDYKAKNQSKTILKSILEVLVFAVIIAVILLFVIPYFRQNPRQKTATLEEQILTENYEKLKEQKEYADQYLKEIKSKDKHIYREIFEAELQESAGNQSYFYDKLSKVDPLDYCDDNKHKLDSLMTKIADVQKLTSLLSKTMKSKESTLTYTPSIQPIYNPEAKIPVYGFGTLIDPIYKMPVKHEGLDFAIPEGTPIFATANGKVSFAGRKRAKGVMVEIDHMNGYETLYGHLSSVKVTKGMTVKRGDVIGLSGNTGKSFIEHLHYEVHYKGEPVNPMNFFFLDLEISQYAKMQKYVSRAGISLD